MFPGSNIRARDASGNPISLLNDPVTQVAASYYPASTTTASCHAMYLPSTASATEIRGRPHSDMDDWQIRTGPRPPPAPGPVLLEHEMLPTSSHKLGFIEAHYYAIGMRKSCPSRPDLKKGRRRYPCRFRATRGCGKTFTTSGHASRHSKIHTAEKAVACGYPGCEKKFHRADNMKQHMESHYKCKSSAWQKIFRTHTLYQASEKLRSEPCGPCEPCKSDRHSIASLPNHGFESCSLPEHVGTKELPPPIQGANVAKILPRMLPLL